MVVLVLGVGVLMNHIVIDEEDTLGSSVRSSDGITYGGKPIKHCWKIAVVTIQMQRLGGGQDVVNEADE